MSQTPETYSPARPLDSSWDPANPAPDWVYELANEAGVRVDYYAPDCPVHTDGEAVALQPFEVAP